MSRTVRFAWQSFSLPITDDWRPAVISGTFREGYVRLEGDRESVIQVRWKSSKPVKALNRRVLEYFSQIEKTAKRAKQDFHSELDVIEEGLVEYHWHAGAKGYGRMWFDAEAKRVFFVERSGRGTDSFKRDARELFDQFESHTGERRPWSLLGLLLSLPSKYDLSSFKLLSGRTTLNFKTRGSKLIAERWAFASQILSKHPIEDWAVSATGIKSDPMPDQSGLKLSRGRKTALVLHDEPNNQLLVLNAVHSAANEPQWDYFASI